MSTGRRLVRDETGAVLITGLFMAFLLCSATWFIFGIAKAAIFRERVQEAADAAAFSAAVVHAKGMNLIAAINLIFFAVTSVWLTLRIFEHGMYLLQTGVVWNASNCEGRFCRIKQPCELGPLSAALTASGAGGPAAACQAATTLQEVRKANKEARQSIGDGMFATFPHLSAVQDATARLAPAAGTAASLAIGHRFGHLTVAVSPSLVPAEDLARIVDRGDPLMDRPLGLPVVPRKFGSLCNRAATLTLGKVRGAFGLIPGLSSILDQPLVKEVIDRAVGVAAGKVEGKFCGDNEAAGHAASSTVFKLKGPKGMFGHAENGNDLMQVWAFTHGELADVDAKQVAIASRKGPPLLETHHGWYLAQAEMFFDCDGGWGDAQCNGNDNAVYSMRWRARLRRVRRPNAGAELGRYLRDALFSGPVKDALKKELGLTGYEGAQQILVDQLFDKAMVMLTDQVNQRAGLGNANLGGLDPEVVH